MGRVLDAGTGEPRAGARVDLLGSSQSAVSGIDGRYTLLGVPSGEATVRARLIGYSPKTVSGIRVPANGAVMQDITLVADVIQLEEVVVSAAVERGSISLALEEQRHALTIISTITPEQIRRSPDGDAGQAVQRVSGVTVQDGKYVFVRGLGERYTTTTLNGARIPSPEPERRVVPLDLFPSTLLDAITTSKTFTPDQPGDFSGAEVNLRTREFPERRQAIVAASFGINTLAFRQDVLKAPPVGREWLGFAGRERALPDKVRQAGNLQGISFEDLNQLTREFRNAWTADRGRGAGNVSSGLSLGGEIPVFGVYTGYVASLTYSHAQEIRHNEKRAVAQPGTTAGTFEEHNHYQGSTGRESVLWGGVLNFTTRLGGHSKIALDNTYTRSADHEASRVAGLHDGFNFDFDITRLTFVERSVRSTRLSGEHLLSDRHQVDWALTLSGAERYEPDRSDLVYFGEVDRSEEPWSSTATSWFGAAKSATRAFSEVEEGALESALNYRLSVGRLPRPATLKLGVYQRGVDRDADTRAFDILALGLTEEQRSAPAEEIFDGRYAEQNRFLMVVNTTGRYDATDRLRAAYAQLEVPFGRLQFVGGARVEQSRITVNSVTIADGDTTSQLDDTDVLPSAALNVRLSGTQALRLSASQTLSRPELRELSPVSYFDILGGQRLFGNAALRRALIQNYDLRWEWYVRPGEIVSLAGFAKRFNRPIERVLVQTSDGASPDATFLNAESAWNYGVEVELRKRLDLLHPSLMSLSVFANATLMRSEIRPNSDDISSLTNDQRPMVGQAPYVVNAGLTYATLSGRLNATVLYNVVSRRIYEAGILPLPDSYEEARHLVDASLQFPITRAVSAKLDGKNLLDPEYRLTQGTVERLRYRSGRVISLGLRAAL